jgi:hypothetical protein
MLIGSSVWVFAEYLASKRVAGFNPAKGLYMDDLEK